MQQATLVLASIFVSQPEPFVDKVEVSSDMAASFDRPCENAMQCYI